MTDDNKIAEFSERLRETEFSVFCHQSSSRLQQFYGPAVSTGCEFADDKEG